MTHKEYMMIIDSLIRRLKDVDPKACENLEILRDIESVLERDSIDSEIAISEFVEFALIKAP